MDYRRTILLLLTMITLSNVVSTVYAQDLLVLEALIANHKTRSNALRNRAALIGQGAGLATIEKERGEEYDEVLDILSNRFGGMVANITFGADIAAIGVMTKDVTELEGKAFRITSNAFTDNQDLFVIGLGVNREFTNILKRMAWRIAYVVSSGLSVTMATPEQRKQFTTQTSEDLRDMRDLLRSFIRFASIQDETRLSKTSLEEQRLSRLENLERIRIQAFEKAKKIIDTNVDKLSKEAAHE